MDAPMKKDQLRAVREAEQAMTEAVKKLEEETQLKVSSIMRRYGSGEVYITVYLDTRYV